MDQDSESKERLPQRRYIVPHEPKFPKGGVFQYPTPEYTGWLDILEEIPKFKKEMLLRDFLISYDI